MKKTLIFVNLQIVFINGLNSSLVLNGNTEHLYGAIIGGSDKNLKYFFLTKLYFSQ